MRWGDLPGLALAVGLAVAAPVEAASSCDPTGTARATSTALVFSGGGAKGAYEAGVALGFRERGIRLAAVAGTSAGAMNAALVASGQEDLLVRLWRAGTN